MSFDSHIVLVAFSRQRFFNSDSSGTTCVVGLSESSNQDVNGSEQEEEDQWDRMSQNRVDHGGPVSPRQGSALRHSTLWPICEQYFRGRVRRK